MITLPEVFEIFAPQLNILASDLMAYADEDTIGGYNVDPNDCQWPMGSLWAVEGKILYSLIRATRPREVLEIGCYFGCSATHILTALQKNRYGHLTSIDIEPMNGTGPASALRKRWTFVQAEAGEYIRAHDLKVDFAWEDAFHLLEGTTDILTAVRDVCQPRIAVSHDAQHFSVGEDVRAAWSAVYGEGNYSTALIAPSDCGLAWRIVGNE